MKKVIVGMSGGVDSSAAALLLKNQGYDVTGVTLKLFSQEDVSGTKTCGSLSDISDARNAADKMGFEHQVVDLSDDFRRYVMKYFCDSYFSGDTPNPCIECNRHIKFGAMLDYALESDYDYIATGHYAVCEYDELSGRWLLKRPKDRSKDQTYVLYSLTQEQLSHILFPLGNMEKSEARDAAESAGLTNSHKSDSQDICFVPDGDYTGFIRKFTGNEAQSGMFLDVDGNILGEHRGIINYTIGQRKGLGVSAGRPLYVVKKNTLNNTVVLGDEKDLYTDSLIAYDVNLISVPEITEPIRITAKTRYSQKEQTAVLSSLGNGEYLVQFEAPQRAVTSGQAVVFYDGDIVVGGGIIK